MNENETNIISKMSIKVIGGGVYLKNRPQTITITWEIKDENGNIITPDTLSVNNIPLDPTTTSKTYHRVFSDVDFTVRAVKDGVLAIGTTTARFVGPTQTVEDSLTSNSRSIAASANSVRLLNKKIENNSSFKGLFTSLDDLKKKLRSGNNGDWAIVGEGIPAPIYIWNKNGWEATGGQYTGSTIDLDNYYTKENVANYTDDYNVSKNHSHIVKIYDLVNWKVVERKPDAPVFQLGQSYDAGEVVNMTDDNDSSYECLQSTITAPYLNQEVRSFTLAEAISFLPEDLRVTSQKISFLSSELNAWMTYVFTGGDYTNPTYWEIFTNNIDPDTNQKIADLQAKDEDLQNQINEDVINLNNHIAESDAKFEEIDNTLSEHEDRMDDIEDEILLSSVEAACAPKDVEILADRAYKDHLGNVIADEYITRDTLTEEIIDITNQQVTDIKPGSIQPEDLSEAVKQMFGAKKITNLPDEEDITVTEDNTLKFKDREYSPKDYSGMGKKILRKHYIDGINTLTQHMINKPNTIYVIRYDYCLQGQTIEIPENCILDFQGGTIKNGTINCNNTIINGLHIFSNVVLTGNYNEGTTHTDLFIINDDITQVLTTLLNDNFCETINVNGDFQFNPVNVNLIKNKKLNINGTITLTSTFNINRSIEINGIGVNAGIQFGKPTGGIFTESKNFEGEDLFRVTGSARKVFNNISLKSENSVAIRLSHSNSNVGALFEFNDIQFYSRNNYCIYIDNVFWVWFNRCIIFSITNNNIYIFSRGAGNSYAGLIKICDSILALGNIKIDSTVGGGLDIVDCTHESLQSGESFIEIINGKMFCVSMDNVEIADASANVYIIDANDLNTFLVKNHRGEITFKTEKRPTNYSNDSAYRNTIYTNTGITFDDKGLNSGETSYGISTYKNIYRGYSPIGLATGYNIPVKRWGTNTNYFKDGYVSFNGENSAKLMEAIVPEGTPTLFPMLLSISVPSEIKDLSGWVVVSFMAKNTEENNIPLVQSSSALTLDTNGGDASYSGIYGEKYSTMLLESCINNRSWHLCGAAIKVNTFGSYLRANFQITYSIRYLISKPTIRFYRDDEYTLEDVLSIIKSKGYQGDKDSVGVIGNLPFCLGEVDYNTNLPVGSIAYSENDLVLGTEEGNVSLKKVNKNIVSYSNRIPSNVEDYSDGDIVYIYYSNTKGLAIKDGDKFVRWDGESASNKRQGNSSERPTEIAMNGYFYMDTQLNVPIWYNRNSWIEADGQPASILRKGTTAQKPNNANAGFQYFDTVINKPIWWTGSKWVDATGTDV